MSYRVLVLAFAALALAAQVCGCPGLSEVATPVPSPTEMPEDVPTVSPPAAPPLPAAPADEPVLVEGTIPHTSRFFVHGATDAFLLLEDQAGFVRRDREFEFPLEGQVMGPVEALDEDTMTYSLMLPSVPQATFVDVDNDDEEDTGVQVFAIAYWTNTWGNPFLEKRDGMGWSNAYVSTITDPERDDEIEGGILIVWAPDDQQDFPIGFGDDEMLFTADDPVGPIPAGYNIVDLNQEPFEIYKEANPQIDLYEGEIAVNDYSDLGYEAAFDALFDKASREYPFTADKDIDWGEIYDTFAPQVADARNAEDYYRAIRDFTWAVPDGHVGVSIDGSVFFSERGGSFGLVLAELNDGRVIVTHVVSDTAADEAGFRVGAEIVEWDGLPVAQAIDQVQPYFGPYSTAHHRRLEQVTFLTRVPPSEEITVTFENPGEDEQTATMTADIEYDSLFQAIPYFAEDPLTMPVEGRVLPGSGLGYIRITTFSEDYNTMASLWDFYLGELVDNDIPGLIIDLRVNLGGNSGLARDFAGYFFDDEFVLLERLYYSDETETFELQEPDARVEPGPLVYDGPIAILVSPYCASACEGFAYALTHDDRAFVVGHYPTSGMFGEVGRGQYELPDDLSVQFPTGRAQTIDGELLIEGVGVVPDILVPVTEDSALRRVDTVLEAAVTALLEELGR